MLRKPVYAVLVAFLLLVFVTLGAASAQSGERISSFVSSISIDNSSEATILETISYDFSSNQRHGIFRDIPIQYIVEGDQGYKLNLNILNVTRDGIAEPFELIDESPSYTRVKIGSSSTTLSGSHSYKISYTIGPVATAANDGSEIVRFDVPGTGWDIPIDSVTVNVSSPSNPATQSVCYEGITGSTAQTCNIDGSTFRASRSLFPGETITTETSYSSGSFNKLAVAETLKLTNATPIWVPITIASFITGLIVTIGGWVGVGHWRHIKRRKEEISYPRYEPPKELGPAELGLLIDNSSSGAELTATLMNLAVSGFIKIVQIKEKKWYRKAEYELQLIDTGKQPSRNYENDLLIAIFNGSETTINTKKLATSQKFRTANIKFHKQLKKNLSNLGFYKKASVFSPTLASRMSNEGYQKWGEIEGFREFLLLTEANRMAMLEAPELKPEQFSEFLPYAVSLGVEKQWAKQFEHLEVDTSQWYEGSRSMNSVLLASSLSSGLGSVSASANSSSGTSGSGGSFSGGGFSGGGGGSW